MPRPILGTKESVTIALSSSTPLTAPRSTLQGPRLQQRLRQTRSRAYLESMACLDAGTHNADRPALEALIGGISHEFPELGIEQRPVGIVSRCWLGAPYEVHICDLTGGIVQHFETFRSMPVAYERSRMLAIHPAYAFVEIYPDKMRAIAIDGSVSVIEK